MKHGSAKNREQQNGIFSKAPSRRYKHKKISPRAFVEISAGIWIIVFIALISTIAVLMLPGTPHEGLEMWTFSRVHAGMYEPVISRWNAEGYTPTTLYVLSQDALTDRMMSGFLARTPVADLIEVERSVVGRVFSGPVSDIGLVDITDRVKNEGVYEAMNEPSFSAWSTHGHIFGLPHDVHPVMLAYRADIVEAAGIDVAKIETWDDFVREMSPLLKSKDREGQPNHYPLNIWYTASNQVEALILQAGGGYFDDDEKPIMNSESNAKVVASVISWTTGPNRIAADAPEFSASGNELRLEGYIVCSIAPDWLVGVWKTDLQGLSGKMKFMPLPAWEKGGRHTSVWGGTMLGISKSTPNVERAWSFARHLYLSDELARRLYETNGIISPVKRLWQENFYDVPDPFFRKQAPGRMFIQLAPDVPRRTSSPYNNEAKQKMEDVLAAVREYSLTHGIFTVEGLLPEARRQLAAAQIDMQHELARNRFLSEEAK